MVRADPAVPSSAGWPEFVGISDATGARGVSMQLVVIPRGARAEPRLHPVHETIVYLLSGRVDVRWGDRLEHSRICVAGDFILTPPGVVHAPRNLSDTEPAHALAARNDPRQHERTVAIAVPAAPTGS